MQTAVQQSGGNILVKCKKCGRSGTITLPADFHILGNGLRNILVPAGTVCNHGFLAFVDGKFQVRGYQHIDCPISMKNVVTRPLLELEGEFEESTSGIEIAGTRSKDRRNPEIQAILKNFSNRVELIRAVLVISHQGKIFTASEEDYAIAGDLMNLVTTISEFSLGVSHQLGLNDAPNFLEIQGPETRTLIFMRTFGFIVITHRNPNQGIIAVTTRKLVEQVDRVMGQVE